MGANNLDGQHVVTHEILSFASLHCTEWRGKPINPHKTCGDASTMVDVDDKKGPKRLAWAIHDGVLLPGDPHSSRASMTGCGSWQVPISWCSRENTILIIAPVHRSIL